MSKRIYTVTGAKGSGKSTVVAFYLPPSQIHRAVIVDTEDSMSDILDNLERNGKSFGRYIRMYDRFSDLQNNAMINAIAEGKLPWVDTGIKQSALVQYWEYLTEVLAETLDGNESRGDDSFIYLGLDTIEPIEAAMTAWVDTHKKEAGWSGQMAYGRRETEGVRPLYEGFLEAVHQAGIRDFCLASHLKPVWEQLGGKEVRRVPNKVKTGGRIAVLSRLSSQMWWLIPRPDNPPNPDGAPAGVRLKARKGQHNIGENDSWDHRGNILPARIPHFTWEDIRWYEEHGCDLIHPADGEVPSKQELDMISEFLNEEQMKLMVLGAQAVLEKSKNAVQVARQPPVDQTKLLLARKLQSEGKSLDEIRKELLETFPPPLRSTKGMEVVEPVMAILSQ